MRHKEPFFSPWAGSPFINQSRRIRQYFVLAVVSPVPWLIGFLPTHILQLKKPVNAPQILTLVSPRAKSALITAGQAIKWLGGLADWKNDPIPIRSNELLHSDSVTWQPGTSD